MSFPPPFSRRSSRSDGGRPTPTQTPYLCVAPPFLFPFQHHPTFDLPQTDSRIRPTGPQTFHLFSPAGFISVGLRSSRRCDSPPHVCALVCVRRSLPAGEAAAMFALQTQGEQRDVRRLGVFLSAGKFTGGCSCSFYVPSLDACFLSYDRFLSSQRMNPTRKGIKTNAALDVFQIVLHHKFCFFSLFSVGNLHFRRNPFY